MWMRSDRPAPRPPAAHLRPPPPPGTAGPASDERGSPGVSVGAASPAPAADPLIAGWFREHAERVWRIVARMGVPAHSVEDIVQETFLTASRRRADIKADHEGSFLVGAAIRLSANYRRKAHVRYEVAFEHNFERDTCPLPDAEQLLIAKRSHELLVRLLGELPEAQRTVFVLYELEGLSVPEIASALALPLGTVSSRVWRARAHFSEIAAGARRRDEAAGES